jgi:hypothetical protein
VTDRAALGSGVVGLALAAFLAPTEPLLLPIELRWLAAFLLFVVLPGWLLVRLLLPTRPDEHLETALLVIASGYSLAMLLGMALHAVFQPVAPWQIAAGGGLLVLALVLAAARRLPSSGLSPSPPNPLSLCAGEGETTASAVSDAGARDSLSLLPRVPGLPGWPGGEGQLRQRLSRAWPVLLVLAVAAPLRLLDLGWSEFQGDEARVVLRAMAALQGADGALAAHRKVPGEILLAYLFAGSLGQIVEQVARL